VAESQRLEPTDRALAERADAGKLEFTERRADVRLCHADLNSTLLEVFGERLQLTCVALGRAAGHHAAAGPRSVVQVAGRGAVKSARRAGAGAAEVDALRHVVVAALRGVDRSRIHRLQVVSGSTARVRVTWNDLQLIQHGLAER